MHILSGKSKCIDRSTSRERERERERETERERDRERERQRERETERDREMCVLFEFRHFLTLRTPLSISKFRVSKKSDRVTVLHYKRHLCRWRASENVLVF